MTLAKSASDHKETVATSILQIVRHFDEHIGCMLIELADMQLNWQSV